MRHNRITLIMAAAVILGVVQQRHCQAVIFSDEFNRLDGTVGNGWSNWGDFQPDDPAARIFGQHLVAESGGIYRTCPLQPGFPFSFDFDFVPQDSDTQAAWSIQFNTTNPSLVGIDDVDRLVYFGQNTTNGVPDTIRYKIGRNLYDSHGVSANSRRYTTWAHISGQVAADLSATITVDYGDGGPPALYAWPSPGIDAITISQGTTVALGANRQNGPTTAYFDNFVPTPEPSTALLLLAARALTMRRRHAVR
jgi:hypothetical protein